MSNELNASIKYSSSAEKNYGGHAAEIEYQ